MRTRVSRARRTNGKFTLRASSKPAVRQDLSREFLVSIKKGLPAVVATLTLAGGVAAAVPLSASAATPACGPSRLSVFSPELGRYAHPNFVEHVFGGIAMVGQPTGLNTASSSDSSEDFINPHPGDVSAYYAMGLVSAEVTVTTRISPHHSSSMHRGNPQRTMRGRRS